MLVFYGILLFFLSSCNQGQKKQNNHLVVTKQTNVQSVGLNLSHSSETDILSNFLSTVIGKPYVSNCDVGVHDKFSTKSPLAGYFVFHRELYFDSQDKLSIISNIYAQEDQPEILLSSFRLDECNELVKTQQKPSVLSQRKDVRNIEILDIGRENDYYKLMLKSSGFKSEFTYLNGSIASDGTASIELTPFPEAYYIVVANQKRACYSIHPNREENEQLRSHFLSPVLLSELDDPMKFRCLSRI